MSELLGYVRCEIRSARGAGDRYPLSRAHSNEMSGLANSGLVVWAGCCPKKRSSANAVAIVGWRPPTPHRGLHGIPYGIRCPDADWGALALHD
jgi:hypothetical protein